MNLLLSCIGKRGYIADYFREVLPPGSRIIGTSNTPWTPGFSRCDEAVILPPLDSDAYVPALLDECSRRKVSGLLSMFDPDVRRLAPHRADLLARGVVPVLPAERAATIAFDKMETHRFLSAQGVLTPETTETFGAAMDGLREGRLAFPLIVKPRFGFGSANTFLARSENELRVFFDYAPGMIVQQFVEAEALNVDGLGSLEAEPVSVVPWRKWLSTLGETERAETVECSELVRMAEELVRSVGIIGPFDGDFFRDSSGRLWVLELNLRFGGGYPVSHLAGADFPRLIVDMIRGKQVSNSAPYYKPGVTMMKRLVPIPGPSKEES
ncbi:MAG: ATP-grasp domain-containing protein [Chthoniobacterales bacterium]|nr:ATP-grasp domain-containing protein [Chthoniobacterales bacterium]